jgi:hypothetical protein
MSIQNLIDTYMGNPAPLARKVQQDSQGQPSGGIPPDLEQALALQKIQEMHQAAQTQQAMQAGGPQPTVVQKLQQMLAQAQHQAQPQGMMPPGQGQPQGAPQGAPQMPQMPPQGGIDQLPTNVGQHMAGGGIVAFAGGGDEGLSERDQLRRMEAAYNPAMTRGLTRGTETQPVETAPASLRKLVEQQITGDLNLNREAERDKGAEYYKNTVGLDALLQEMENRNQAREARIAENKAERTPEWIKGLQALGGAPIHGGIGMVLGKLGQGATAARDAYGAEDMKYADEMDKLRDIITKAKIEGNTAVANAGIAALKETDAARRGAMTSGTSLLNTDELSETRRANALDQLAMRKLQLSEGQLNRSANVAAAQDAHFRDRALVQANAMAAKIKDPKNGLVVDDPYPNLTQDELADQLFETYYKRMKSGKMTKTPVGGTETDLPPDVAALVNKYGAKK